MEERCSKQVFDNWHQHPCTRKGIFKFEGKLYCAQHDPVRVAKKQADKNAKWDADWAVKKERWRWEAAAHEVCAGMTAEELEQLGADWLLRRKQ